MPCANASGTHKLQLVFIYKYENPRALKRVNKKNLPVSYYNQAKAWMNNFIFDRWFNSEFVPLVRKHLRSIGIDGKAILVLDNAPAHLKFLKEANVHHVGPEYKIFCVFLPANTTSILQPMDQAVLDTLKRYCRKKLMCTALNELNEEKTMIEVKKNITIRDAIHWAAEAW